MLSFRYIDGIYFRIGFSTRRSVGKMTKSWPGGTPANPAALDVMPTHIGRKFSERQRELFGRFQRRGLDASFSEVAREILGVAVHRVDLLGA
jgi:hypothetical protein